MGSSSTISLPSKSEVENQSKANNNTITPNYKPSSNNYNLQINHITPNYKPSNNNNDQNNMAPPPLTDQHPIDDFSFEKNAPKEKINKPEKANTINNQRPIQPNQQLRQNQTMPMPNIPHGQIGIAYQPMGIAQGVPIVNPVGYPMAYYGPPGYPYVYPNYAPQPMPGSVVVVPPGYKPDNSCGYSPWGDLGDDLRNLF